jgi:hypothetical protein
MAFQKILPEILLSVADQVDTFSDLNALSRVSRRFHACLTPMLYRRAIQPLRQGNADLLRDLSGPNRDLQLRINALLYAIVLDDESCILKAFLRHGLDLKADGEGQEFPAGLFRESREHQSGL